MWWFCTFSGISMRTGHVIELSLFSSLPHFLSLSLSLPSFVVFSLWADVGPSLLHTQWGFKKAGPEVSAVTHACCLNLCVSSSSASRLLGLEMPVPRCGVPRFLLILLGPVLFAAGWTTAESQGEESVRDILWMEKWMLKWLTTNRIEDERVGTHAI